MTMVANKKLFNNRKNVLELGWGSQVKKIQLPINCEQKKIKTTLQKAVFNILGV
jgi:hypothetical protein